MPNKYVKKRKGGAARAAKAAKTSSTSSAAPPAQSAEEREEVDTPTGSPPVSDTEPLQAEDTRARTPTPEAATPRRKITATVKRPPLKLNSEQSDTIFEFVEAREELFAKSHPKFMDTAHKLKLWEEIASILKITDFDGGLATGDRIKTWFQSQRSVYGRCTKVVSGQAPKVLTQTEIRLVDKLHFLSPYLYRLERRGGKDLIGKLRVSNPDRFTEAGPPRPSAALGRPQSGSESDTDTLCDPPRTPATATARVAPTSGKKKKTSEEILCRLDTTLKEAHSRMSRVCQEVRKCDKLFAENFLLIICHNY